MIHLNTLQCRRNIFSFRFFYRLLSLCINICRLKGTCMTSCGSMYVLSTDNDILIMYYFFHRQYNSHIFLSSTDKQCTENFSFILFSPPKIVRRSFNEWLLIQKNNKISICILLKYMNNIDLKLKNIHLRSFTYWLSYNELLSTFSGISSIYLHFK